MSATPIDHFIASLVPAFESGDAAVATKATEASCVALVQEQYRAIGRGDFQAFLETLADDIELEIVGPPSIPFVGRWQGRDVVAEAVRCNFSWLEDQRPEILSVVAQGDTVVVSAQEKGCFRATGKEYEVHWVQFFTCRDGRVVRFVEVFDSAPLLDAIGGQQS